jgi:hypothetical protein
MEAKMNMQLKTLWAATLSAALCTLPSEPALAHRGGDTARVQARQLCGGQVQGQRLSRLGARSNDPARQALRDLVALECLYRRDGRSDQIEAMYRDVLAKATQPLLRSVAYRRLARMAWRKGEHEAAEDLLKRSLQENLK